MLALGVGRQNVKAAGRHGVALWHSRAPEPRAAPSAGPGVRSGGQQRLPSIFGSNFGASARKTKIDKPGLPAFNRMHPVSQPSQQQQQQQQQRPPAALPRGKALLQERIQQRIQQRLELTQQQKRDDTNAAPRDDKIPHPMITLITLDGTIDGVHPLSHVLRTTDLNEYTLVLVDSQQNPPACRLFSRKLLYERERQAKKSQRAAARGSKMQVVQMSAAIGDHDLGIKLRKVGEILDKGKRVAVVVEHKGRDRSKDRRKEVGAKVLEQVQQMGWSPSGPPVVEPNTWSLTLNANKPKKP
ncbi:hypothetical protein LPJ53_004748 [Coemansia erecta]|uniref:Translation initiation factor 3 N-terminal domain-containing protein n=1 Tax=Coemansia erecta TaxID=147472 RepID=A0A9W8CNV2_9FUNG|nr:hypothetical protein LPJ53_004748 [Coemansia erecta]